jgi:hypothetical protein
LPKLIGASSRVAVVYPEREFVPPQVRAFVDAVVAWAPSEMQTQLPERCQERQRGRKAVARG